ncbi:YdcF family protein [Scardovia wiggsiae]
MGIAVTVWCIIGAVFVAAFIAMSFIERRTPFYGFFAASVLGVVLAVYSIVLLNYDPRSPWIIPVGTLFVILLIAVSIGPAAVGVTCIISGIRLIRREGASWHNFLSIGLGVVLGADFALIFMLPRSGSWLTEKRWPAFILGGFEVVSFYAALVVISYLITLWLNSINIPTRKLDYIVILGCGVIGGAVPPLLESRIRKGISVFERNPHSILVMSGGRGPGEDIAEAEAMQKWAVAHNVDPARILVEDRSRNTQQNIRFSKKLISEDAAARYPGKRLDPGAGRRTKIRVAVVTSRYHLLRGLLLARDEHLDCIGYGARTKLYFFINAFVREFVGYLSIRKKFHLITVSAIVLLYTAFLLISM